MGVLNATASAKTRAGQIRTRTKARMVSVTDMAATVLPSHVRRCLPLGKPLLSRKRLTLDSPAL